MKKLLLSFLFLITAIVQARAQNIIKFTDGFYTLYPYTFTADKITTEANGHNLYSNYNLSNARVEDDSQGIIQIRWNTSLSRWEILLGGSGFSGPATPINPLLLWYSTKSTSPKPPDVATGNWQTPDPANNGVPPISLTSTTGDLDTGGGTPAITVSNIAVSNSNPTNASSVTFTVTFSGSAANVTPNAFSLTTTGLSGAQISNVNGSGTTYTVTVNTGSGTGTVRLDVNGTGITPAVSNVPYNGVVLNVDHTAPAAPSAPNLADANDSGLSGSDNITNVTTPVFTGTTEAGAVVTLYDNNGTNILGTAPADGFGNWSITSLLLSEGTHSITAKAKDAAGNVSAASSALSVTIDITAPTATISSTPPSITNNTTGTFQFSSNEDGSFQASLDGGPYIMVSSLLTYTGLSGGPHTLLVKAIDVAGNGSQPASYGWTIDLTPPTVTDANISISGTNLGTGGAYKIGSTVTATWNNTVAGDSNSDIASVTVDFSQFGGGSAVTATNNGNSWTATYTIPTGSLDATNRNVSVTATDNAGNVSTRADGTGATVDNQPPDVTAANISISGATGTGGAFKVDDVVVANWNNTASGDNNSDIMSGVTMNFSDFGGGSAVAATNIGGVWTATYRIVAGVTFGANKNVSVTATDNAGNTTTTADDANASIVNSPPVLTASAGAVSYTPGGSAVVIDGGITISYADNITLSSATISISGNFSAGDVLNYPLVVSGISGSYSDGTLTLGPSSGSTASLADFVAALHAVTFSTTSTSTAQRTITFTVNDGTTTSAAVTRTIIFAPATTIASASFSADTGPFNNDFSTNTASQTISGTLSANLIAGEIVEISLDNGATYVVATSATGSNTFALAGVTLTGSNTLNIKVHNAVGDGPVFSQPYVLDITAPAAPSAPDLDAASDKGFSSTDNLTNVSTPTFTGTAEANATIKLYDTNGTTVVGTGTANAITGAWSITSSTLSAGTHSVTAKATDVAGNTSVASSALLVIIDTAIPTVSITSDKSSLKKGETATITFTFSEDPGTTFTWDGTAGDITVSGGTLGAISRVSPSTTTFSAVFTPTDNTNAGGATITVATGSYASAAGNDGAGSIPLSITFDTQAPVVTAPNISISGGTGPGDAFKVGNTVTAIWNGSASGDNESDISTVTVNFSDFGGGIAVMATNISGIWTATYVIGSNVTLGTGKHISATATDHAGNASTVTGVGNATIINTGPTLTATTSTPTFTEGGSAVSLFSGAAVGTVEDGQIIISLKLTVSSLGDDASEILNVDGTNISLTNGNSVTTLANGINCSVSVAAGTATVTMSKTGGIPVSAANTLIDGLAYKNTSNNPTSGSRTVTLTSIQDNGGTANGGIDQTTLTPAPASTVTVTAVNNAPTLTATASSPTFTEGGAAVQVFSSSSASTVESGQKIISLKLTISGLADGVSEILYADDTNITLTNGTAGTTTTNSMSYSAAVSAGTATVTLSKTSGISASAVNTLIDNLAYKNNSNNPTGTSRIVTLTSIQDDGGTANGGIDQTALSLASTVTITPVNNAPVAVASSGAASYTTWGSDIVVDGGITVTDVDNPTLASATVTLSGAQSGDILKFTNGGATMGNIAAGPYNAATGVISLTSAGSTATLAQWQAALQAITFTTTSVNTSARTASFVVNDGANNSTAVTRAINITAPVITTTGSFSGLSTTYGTASAAGGISVSGSNLSAGITATPSSADFEVSSNGTNFSPSVTIGTSGSFSGTVYVRLKGTAAANTYTTGSISLTSTGANNPVVTIPSSTVSKFPVTLTAQNINKTYGQTLSSPVTGSTAFTLGATLPNSETIGSVTVAYGAGAAATDAANTYTGSVTASAATGGTFTASNYNITYNPGNIIVGQANLTITANDVNKTYGDATSGAAGSTAFSSSGLVNSETIGSVTVAYGAGAAATDAANTYTGSVTASAATGGTFTASNYNITYNPGNIIVGQANLTITANDVNKTYGDAISGAAGSTAFSSSGLVNSETIGSVTVAYGAGAAATDAVNTYTGSVVASAATGGTFTASNYNITYNPGNIIVGAKAITVTADAKSKTYGDADPALTYAVTSGALVGSDAFTGALTRDAGENINTYAITQGTLALSNNYALTYVPASLTIGAKAITVTADAKSKTYGDADPALTYAVTSGALVGSDAFTGALTRDAGENINTYTITQGTLALSSNYALTYVPASLTIGAKAITVTADAKSKTYGDADPALTYAVTSGALVGSDAFTGALTRDAGENINTYAITQGTLALSNNYALTYVPANLTIGAKAITVTADAKSKTYGDADPALTYAVTSGALVGSDAFTGALTRDAGENVNTYTITQGTLALSNNYALTYVPANLTIGAKAITVTADAKSKTYGDADPALTYAVTSGALVGSDAFTGALTRDAGENVNTYAITQGTLALNSNYNLTYEPASLTISARAITVTADAKSKTYGSADPALTYQITTGNLVNNDAFTGSLTRDAGESAGTYAIRQGTLALSNNYALTYIGASFIVNNSTLNFAELPSKTYGDADFSGGATSPNSDPIIYSSNNTAVATIINNQIHILAAGTAAITASQTGATSLTRQLTISKAILTVTADNKSRNYGQANPALTVTYSGFVNGDSQNNLATPATARTTATNRTAPGTYPIIASGAVSANYNFNFVNGILTIIPLTNADLASLTISEGSLSPAFATATHNYTTAITNGTDHLSLTPTPADASATVRINGTQAANGSPSDIALNVGNNTITIEVTAQDGITKNSYTITVYRGEPLASITATNILTPNNDGKNDTWVIQDIQLYPNNIVTVYDKAGRVVYSKHGYNNDWDGTIKGSPLTEGTYYYIVDLGTGLRQFKGFITLLRSH